MHIKIHSLVLSLEDVFEPKPDLVSVVQISVRYGCRVSGEEEDVNDQISRRQVCRRVSFI